MFDFKAVLHFRFLLYDVTFSPLSARIFLIKIDFAPLKSPGTILLVVEGFRFLTRNISGLAIKGLISMHEHSHGNIIL